ncbi:MAG: hypothetical protein ACE5DM_05370, partial [Candidatus Nanoarchaeia archaeon]
MKRLFAIIFAIILLSSFVSAVDELVIKGIDVEVDGDRDRRADETGGTIKVKPGSEVEIDIKLENIFDKDTDEDINDIDVIGTIADIDDGDDLEEELDIFDLSPGHSNRDKMKFQIPYKVEDKSYELVLAVTAESDNGTDYDFELKFDIDIDKERHELIMRYFDLAPAVVECERDITGDFTILNIGKEDEDDVKIEVLAPSFDYYFTDNFSFVRDPYDSDAEYSKRFMLNATGVTPGIYQVEARAKYGSRTLSEKKTISVGECASAPTTPATPTTPEPTTPASSTTVEP